MARPRNPGTDQDDDAPLMKPFETPAPEPDKPDRAAAAREVVEQTKKGLDEAMQGMTAVPPDVYHAHMAARVRAEALANRQKETIPGGRFYENGRWVNAYGDEIDPDSGKIVKQNYRPPGGRAPEPTRA